MGLDWIPRRKIKPGFEERFEERPEERLEELFLLLEYNKKKQKQEISLFGKLINKLRGKKVKNKHELLQEEDELLQEWDELLQEWEEIFEDHYETIKAPRIGRDSIADNWIKEAYQKSEEKFIKKLKGYPVVESAKELGGIPVIIDTEGKGSQSLEDYKYQKTDKATSEEEYIKELKDCYVVELAKELDGIPVYITLVGDRSAFPGRLLKDCEDLIGEDLVTEAWGSKSAAEALDYGQQLMAIADKVASENNRLYLKEQRLPPDIHEDKDNVSLEQKIHILYAAAKWLIFYGKNGHGFYADF